MAKGDKHKGNKNVFKVAGARSLKAKNKAKVVATNFKKLCEVTKKKTVEVDKLLDDLQETVRQTSIKKAENKPELETPVDTRQEKIDKYIKTQETSAEALEKLNKMEV